MFKKLILVLVLSLGLMLMAGPIFGSEDGQTCTLIQGAKVLQVMSDQSMRPVIVSQDMPVTVGAELTEETVTRFNDFSTSVGVKMEWAGGNFGLIEVDFGRGLTPLMLVFKNEDVKDCN